MPVTSTFLGQSLSVSPRFSSLRILTVDRSLCLSKWLYLHLPSSMFSAYLIPDFKQTLYKRDTSWTSKRRCWSDFAVVQRGSRMLLTILRQRDLGAGCHHQNGLVKPQEQTQSGLQARQLCVLAEVAISHSLPRGTLLFTPSHDGWVLQPQSVAGWMRGHVRSRVRCWTPPVSPNLLHYHKPFYFRYLLLH